MPGPGDDTDRSGAGVSVVVPVHESEETLGDLLAELVPALESVTSRFEVVLVDDGSRDGSWAQIQQASAADPRIAGLRLAHNVGEQGAVLCGIDHSSFGTIVTIDDDLEQPPAAIPALLAELDAGADLVYGDLGSAAHGFGRRTAARVVKVALARGLGSEAARSLSSLRAFRAEVVDRSGRPIGSRPSIDGWLSGGARRVSSVPVQHQRRRRGSSGYDTFDLWVHTSSLLTQYAGRPARAGWLALVASVVSMSVLVAGAVFASATDRSVAPWVVGAIVAGVFTLLVLVAALAMDHLVQIRSHLAREAPYAVAESTPPAGEAR